MIKSRNTASLIYTSVGNASLWIGLICFSMLVPNQASAQKDTLGNQSVNVVKPYQPMLSDGYKISEVPDRDTLTPSSPTFEYEVNPVPFSPSFDVTPIKPVKMISSTSEVNKKYFLKGGVGNYLTTYLEGTAVLTESKAMTSGIHLKHLSSQDKKDAHPFKGISDNELTAFETTQFENSSLSSSVGLERSIRHYYGFKEDPTTYIPSDEDLRIRYRNLEAKTRWKSNKTDATSMQYNIGLSYDNMLVPRTDNWFKDYKAKENNIVFDEDILIPLGKLTYGFKTVIDYNKDKYDTTENGQGIVSFNPRAIKEGSNWTLSTGTNIIFYPHKNSQDKVKWNPRPYSDIKFNYTIFDGVLSAFAGLGGGVQKNNLRSVFLENPFTNPDEKLRYSNTKFDLSAGMQGAWSNKTSWLVRAGFASIDDMLFFANDFNYGMKNKFNLVYDDVEVFSVHGEASHKVSSLLNVNESVDYFHYSTIKLEKPWHKSPFIAHLSADYRLGHLNKIRFLSNGLFFLKTDLELNSRRWAQQTVYDGTYRKVAVKLDPYIDLNLALEYRHDDKLSFFLNLNNVGFSRYQQWMNYRVQSMNALIGAAYSF